MDISKLKHGTNIILLRYTNNKLEQIYARIVELFFKGLSVAAQDREGNFYPLHTWAYKNWQQIMYGQRGWCLANSNRFIKHVEKKVQLEQEKKTHHKSSRIECMSKNNLKQKVASMERQLKKITDIIRQGYCYLRTTDKKFKTTFTSSDVGNANIFMLRNDIYYIKMTDDSTLGYRYVRITNKNVTLD